MLPPPLRRRLPSIPSSNRVSVHIAVLTLGAYKGGGFKIKAFPVEMSTNKLENVQLDLLKVYLLYCLIWVWAKQKLFMKIAR